MSWYNLTVLVKMGFEDLQREDPGLRNHTRLLYSLVSVVVTSVMFLPEQLEQSDIPQVPRMTGPEPNLNS